MNNCFSWSTNMKFVGSVFLSDVIKSSITLLPLVDTKVGCPSLMTFGTQEESGSALIRVLTCTSVDLSPHWVCSIIVNR